MRILTPRESAGVDSRRHPHRQHRAHRQLPRLHLHRLGRRPRRHLHRRPPAGGSERAVDPIPPLDVKFAIIMDIRRRVAAWRHPSDAHCRQFLKIGDNASTTWPDQRSALVRFKCPPSSVARPSTGGEMELVFSAAASCSAMPTESRSELGAPVRTTHVRSSPTSRRNFSPKSLAFSSSSGAIDFCAERSKGTAFSATYGPIQFH